MDDGCICEYSLIFFCFAQNKLQNFKIAQFLKHPVFPHTSMEGQSLYPSIPYCSLVIDYGRDCWLDFNTKKV